MRSNRNIRVGLALIGLAILALLLLSLRRPTVAPPNAQNTVAVPVGTQPNSDGVAYAIGEIPARSIITRDMLRIDKSPTAGSRDVIARSYVVDPDSIVGYITAKPISANAPIQRATDLVGHISEVGISGALLPDRRAMVIPILNKATLHDLIKVGDFVDVIGAFDQQESRAIVQNVRVLAVDVFGKEYPQTSVAQRGDYKAQGKGGITVANPGSPQSVPQGTPQAAPPANGQPAPQGAAPAPTPTVAPGNGQPPAKPEPALTLEVSPDQANAISLATASGAQLDYVLRPRPAIISTVPEVRVAALTKPQLAPFAWRQKNKPSGGSSGSAASGPRTASNPRPNRPDFIPYNPGPQIPFGPGPIGPIPVRELPSAPQTYDIPIYGDGKLMRTDTVRKPQTDTAPAY